MIENNTNLKEHIIEFNKFGLVVFPCIDKKPKIKFKDIEKQLVDEIFELFNDDDELAIRTGKGIVVVDIDTKGNDGQEGFNSLKKLETEYGKLPQTLETKTRSGGVHKFFRINEEDELSNRTNLNGLLGVDIRATNGYVIAPPTKNYEFINIKPMAMLPAKWFHLIKREHKPENNVINLYDRNSEGKIVDNRDDKATKIIFSNLIDLALDKYKNKTNSSYWKGTGYWTRCNPEICLLATKGKPKRVGFNVDKLVFAERDKHSKKPIIIRNKIVELCGDIPRIELFASQKTDGGYCWGNEV